MTTITLTIADIAGVGDNTSWTFYAKDLRQSDAGSISVISPKKVRKYPVNGVLTVQLDPGPAVVSFNDQAYAFTVPASGTYDLWPLIQAAVTIPPGTRHEELQAAVNAWLDANNTGLLWNAIPGKPAVVAEGADQAAARAAIGATSTGSAVFTASNAAAARTALGAADTAALADKAPLTSPAFTGTPTGITKAHVGLPLVDNTADASKPVSGPQQTALNGKQSTSEKGSANGYAPLDSGSKVPAANLPAYVDDVLEAANLAALPGTGETGKIYVTLDNNKSWRWSGSAYVEISPSPGSTDSVTEGSTNLYYTNARADARVAAAVGVTVEPYDADLAAIAALASAASKVPYATGPGAWALADFTAAGRALVDDADAAAQRATLGAQNEVYYDLRRAGAVCDGTTDDTAAWAAAVATVAAAGGGLIWWRGTSVASQIVLSSKVGLLGLGLDVSIIKQKAGRTAGQHLVLLNEADATKVTLRDFTIDGNKANQTGAAAGVYFDNTAGAGGQITHLIRNLHIRNVAGDGLYFGYQMRGSLIDGISTYACDGIGVHLVNFSDNTMQNLDIGRSGLQGIYLETCANSKFSNLKAWYSGQVTPGSAGLYVHNGDTLEFSNISMQENSGSAMVVWGQAATVKGVVVHGLVSDSDNTSATTTNNGLDLNNVANSIFDVAVVSKAPLQAKPYSGVLLTNCTGVKVTAAVDSAAVTWPILGAGISGNDVDLCRGITSSTPAGAFTPTVFQYREHLVTLTGNRTVNNPTTSSGNPPVGLRFRFVFIQDATGGRTLTWSSAYKIPASVSFTTTASTRTVIDFECVANGDWIMTSFATGIPA